MENTDISEGEMKIVIEVATDYIRTRKNWKVAEFEIEVVRRQGDQIIVADVVHVDDLKGDKAESKSVQLLINTASKQVTAELAFQ